MALAQASVACDQFIGAEAALRQNVVSVRVGLVQDYDRTVSASSETERAAAAMQAALRPLLLRQTGRLERVAQGVMQQLDMIEQFKSRNAILRNALAAFATLNARLDPATLSLPEGAAVQRLGMAILELTLNTTPDVVGEVDDQLHILAPVAATDPAALTALVRHAQIIRTGLPIMDAISRFLMSTPDDADVRALRDAVLARQAAGQSIAQDYRYVLSGASGILVLLLVRLAFMLRGRARALHRRAQLERSLAALSARVSEPVGLSGERQIRHALAMLAEMTGADRVCAVLGAGLEEVYVWPSQGPLGDSTWARDVDCFMQRQAGPTALLLHMDGAQHGRSKAEQSLLTSVRLQGLAAARRDGIGILAVGWSREPTGIAQSEAGVLTVALELLIQAQGQLRLALEHARLEVSLRKARRMETLGAFASGIAHNFNNILAAMLGHAEVEEIARRDHGEAAQNLQALRAAGQRGQDLVASILAFGRREAAGPTLLDGRAILQETMALLRVTWPAEVTLHVEDSGGTVPIAGSATQLQQVILNICRNACQAVTGVGHVWVCLDIVELGSAATLSHGTLQPGRYGRFRVRDTGSGMDRETMDQIFEPFFSARMGGNGLGLATAWEIVRDHNGCWNLCSTPGQGSVFEVWLPLEHPQLGRGSVAAELAPAGQGEAVLLVNPNRLSLLRDEEVIAALGFEPVGFDDPATAVAACRQNPDRFSAIVIAGVRHLPDMANLVRTLHLSAPALPILLAVGVSAEVDLEALSSAGLSDIVAYGASAGDLRRALVSWVAGRQAVGSDA